MSDTPEAIVRDLALTPAPLEQLSGGDMECTLCDASDLEVGASKLTEPAHHHRTCAWRRACEWVDQLGADVAGIERLRSAARRVLDSTDPHISALEVHHDADGEELYGDLADALGLDRDYRSGS